MQWFICETLRVQQTSQMRTNTLVRSASLVFIGASFLISASCSGDPTSSGPPSAIPASLAVVAGDNQTGVVGTALAQRVQIMVRDSAGQPVQRERVSFGAQNGSNVDPAVVLTNDDGIATTTWTLGVKPGFQGLAVALADVNRGAMLSAKAVAGPPTQVILVAGQAQIAAVGSQVAVSPTVAIADRYGNVVHVKDVAFTASAGSSATPLDRGDTLSASVTWTLPTTPGPVTLTATAAALHSSVTFTATAYPHFKAISAMSGWSTCAIDPIGDIYCWGDTYGPTPVHITSDVKFTSLTSGSPYRFGCALSTAGAAYCWGNNEAGQLGNNTTVSLARPSPVVGGFRYTQLVSSTRTTCGLTPNGEAYCWGDNANGQFGDSTDVSHMNPVRVLTDVRFTMLTTGSGVCGLATDGSVYCWGAIPYPEGQSASADLCANHVLRSCVRSPLLLPGTTKFDRLVPGTDCGQSQGLVYCWGSLTRFGLNNSLTPQRLPLARAYLESTATEFGVCALASDQKIYCSGQSSSGEFGNGVLRATGLEIGAQQDSQTFEHLYGGGNRLCATTVAHDLYCWGSGPTGSGAASTETTPRPVIQVP